MRSTRAERSLLAIGFFLPALVLEGQGIPTATLSGTVIAEGGVPLAGVTVTAESTHLQGKREVTTHATGEYLFNFLPSGDYLIRFSFRGMQTVEKTIGLFAAAGGRLDVEMQPANVEETVTVSVDAHTGTPLDTTQVMANFKRELTNQLPIARTLHSIALLAPGVTDNGPVMLVSSDKRPGLMLAGAQSYESLYVIDGATVNQNISGQPQELYVEDAVEETTILGGNVSAEYGRFTGGVVNTVTRSGGNELHGSFRTDLRSDGWRALNPDERNFDFDPRIRTVNATYQATLGGFLWKDRIWFFAAGQKGNVADSRYTSVVEQAESGDQGVLPNPYTHSVDERRIQGKLTGNLTPQHNLVVSYVSVEEQETNANTDPPGDLAALISPRRPSSLLTANYNGVLNRNLFVEAQYSQRKSSVENVGSPYSDFLRGTGVSARGALYNSPWFSQGEPERYGNESWLGKVAYVLSTESFGTHDLKVGYEWFSKSLLAAYHNSGSDFTVNAQDVILRGTQAFPVFTPLSGGLGFTSLDWGPLPPTTKTTVVTQSAFFNDRLVWGAHWSFNLGLRYDRTDANTGVGQAVAKSAAWSPRLAAQFDPRGDGRIVWNAGYGKYVSSVQDILIKRFSAAFASGYEWYYEGPCINCDRNAPTSALVPMEEALAQLDAWFQSIGGIESPPTGFVRIAGVSRAVPKGTLETPDATEYSVGVGAALGSRGWARADFLYRDYGHFYNDRQDLSTGQTLIPGSDPPAYADNDVLGNSNALDRKYEAVQAQFQYRFTPAIFAGGSYTWSRLTGNFVGENPVVGAAPGHIDGYPEYRDLSWNNPTGYLAGDQRNIARIWLGGDFPTGFGALGLAVLQSYESGLPYEAVASVPLFYVAGGVRHDYVSNPGYATPPSHNTYYFSKRGEFRTDNIPSTDIALTFTFHALKVLELFVQPQVTNLFNESGSVAEDATVLEGAANGFADFNPLTEKPVRGVNYDFSKTFGQPVAFQQPRTFSLTVGLRF